jgi:multiple sugar transport system substrate-binding protein
MGRRVLRGALLLLAAVLLAACGGQAAVLERTVVVVVTPTPEPTAEGGKIVLRVGTGDSNEGLEAHQTIIARFEAANPDIQVQLEPVGSGDYYGRIFNQIDSGDPPDILQIGDDAVPRFVERGALVPLDDFIGGSDYPLDTGIYLPGVLEPGRWSGKQYLLPKDFSPLAVYYNKALFDEFGVPYPQEGWTMEQFIETARALTQDRDGDGQTDVWGVQLPAAWTPAFEYWAAAAGGKLVSDDGASFIGYMDSPQTVSALQLYADMYHRYKVAPPPVDIKAFGGGNTEFEEGRAAMRLFGHWPLQDLRENPAVDLGVVGLPAGPLRANILLWGGFGISSLSENQEAAWRLLRFYAGAEGAEVWKDWALPTVASVADAAGIDEDALEGVWIAELDRLVPRAYTALPIWGTTGEPALAQLLEVALTDPDADLTAAAFDAAMTAQGSVVVQR